MNPESINVLIESNRYNIEILPQLENYVQYQIEKHAYHFEANLTVLKFYQFHPEKTQKFIIGQILTKALMNLPNTDFALCMYLIPEKLHNEEPVRILSSLAHLLESAQFEAFWEEANTCRELLNTIPGFDDSVRGFIISLVSQTYGTITKTSLGELLHMHGTDLDALINARGWKQSGETVTFAGLDEVTTTKTKKFSESAREDLTRILGSLNAS